MMWMQVLSLLLLSAVIMFRMLLHLFNKTIRCLNSPRILQYNRINKVRIIIRLLLRSRNLLKWEGRLIVLWRERLETWRRILEPRIRLVIIIAITNQVKWVHDISFTLNRLFLPNKKYMNDYFEFKGSSVVNI